MQNLFYIKDSLENKISFYLIVLFLIGLPYDRFYSEVFFICLVFHAIFHFRKKSLQNIPLRNVLLLQSIFILTVVTTAYAPHFKNAVFEWEKHLSIFLFPLVLSTIPLDLRKYRDHFLFFFAIGCTTAVAYLEIDALRIIQYNNLPFSSLFSDLFINANFSAPILLHPTILAIYVALSIACFLYFIFSTRTALGKIACTFCALLLLISLVQLGSKSVLFAFILIAVLFPFFLTTGRNKTKAVIIAMLFLLILVVGINAGTLKNRFVSTFKNDLSNVEVGKSKDEYRIVRWQAALQLIKEAPLFGYGAGSEVAVLKEEYFKRRLFNSYLNQLNAHNQYLSFMLKAGITGIVLYLSLLVWGFVSAFRQKDFLLFSFLVLLAVVSLSENILDVNKGIFFYSFFFSYFILGQHKRAVKLMSKKQPHSFKKRFHKKVPMLAEQLES